MKKLFLFLLIIMSGLSFGQNVKFSAPPKSDYFTFNEGVMNDFAVIEIPHTSKNVIYGRLIEFIKLNYIDFDEALMTSIQNEMIRFQGISNGVLNYGAFHENDGLYYILQIDIQDNKIKVTPQSIRTITEENRKYTLDLPLKQKFSERNIHYDFKDIPVQLNKIVVKINDHLKNGNLKNW